MKKPPTDYYRISALAKLWNWDTSEILHYGKTGKLEICVLLNSETVTRRPNKKNDNGKPFTLGEYETLLKKTARDLPKIKAVLDKQKFESISGVFPLYGEDIPRIYKDEDIERVKSLEDNVSFCFIHPKKIEITDLTVTHKEKLRFEAACCDMVSSSNIGLRERTTWLKIIYLLMHKLVNYQPNPAKTDGINISQLEPILKKEAEKFGLTSTGLSDSNLANIYNEAVSKLDIANPPPPHIKLKKIMK